MPCIHHTKTIIQTLLDTQDELLEQAVSQRLSPSQSGDDAALVIEAAVEVCFHYCSFDEQATAAMIAGSPVAGLARLPDGDRKTLAVEHPGGATGCVLELDDAGNVARAGMLRTTRKLFDGVIF